MSEVSLTESAPGRFSIQGELSFQSVPMLNRKIKSILSTSDAAVIDLSAVVRSDSAGVALLVEWTRMAHLHDKQLSFDHIPDQMLAIVRVSGLADILPLNAS